MSDKIIQIREALYSFMPSMYGFNIINYKWDGKVAHGIFQVNLMSGHTKRIEVKIENDILEIKEVHLLYTKNKEEKSVA